MSSSTDPNLEMVSLAAVFAREQMRRGQQEFTALSRAIALEFDMTPEVFRNYIRTIYNFARDVCRDVGRIDVSGCSSEADIDHAMARVDAWLKDTEERQVDMQWQEPPLGPTTPTEEELRTLMGLALTVPTPDAIMNFTGFVARMRDLAPFNVQMVYAQRPGARHVASRKEWERMGRQVRPGAIPIVVLRPMGPIDYVFEELDTDPPIERQPERDVFAASGDFDPDRMKKLIKSLEAGTRRNLKVRVHRVSLGANLAGWVNGQPIPKDNPKPLVQRGWPEGDGSKVSVWDISINDNLTPAEQFVTLLHELAHLFCGHVGAFQDSNRAADEYGWPDRSHLPKAAMEIEAELVAWWLANREGLTTGSPLYLRPYLEQAGQDVAYVDLDRVTRAVARVRGYLGDRP